jgi:hypothetical protein
LSNPPPAGSHSAMVTRGDIILLGITAGTTGGMVSGLMLGLGLNLIVAGANIGWLLLLPAAPAGALIGWFMGRKLAGRLGTP